MTKPVSLDYRLGEHGWASFDLKIGSAIATVGEFGYCTDALGDLVRAALTIATGGRYAVASFDAEPQEWRLLLGTDFDSGHPEPSLPVRIKIFPDIARRLPETKGRLIFEADTTPDEFGAAVVAATQSVLEAYGVDGYVRRWCPIMNAFPLRALQALKTALAVQEPSLPPG